MKSLFKPPPPKIREVLDGIREALERFLDKLPREDQRKLPDINVAAPHVEVPVIVEQPIKTAWLFRVTERDKNGNICAFTATPAPDK